MIRQKAFTLVELLVTIAIIAILAVVTLLVVNPFQLLAQSRDANRIADMATLRGTIGFYASDQLTGSMGSSSVVYVSVPDPTAASSAGTACTTMGLPTLPSTFAYHCAASSTFKNVSSTGWIPINFQSITSGSPLGTIPVDPVNTTSSKLYYTYTTDGSQFEVTAAMESVKYKLGGANNQTAGDGGAFADLYEKGTALALNPVDYASDPSLVGYWPMDEGTGNTSGVSQTADASGYGNTGVWYGNASGTNSTYYSAGKVGNWAGYFNGTNDYVTTPTQSIATNISAGAWVYSSNFSQNGFVIGKNPVNAQWELFFQSPNLLYWRGGGVVAVTCSSPANSQWHQLFATEDVAGTTKLYIDGVLCNSGGTNPIGNGTNPITNTIEIGRFNNGYNFNGLIDDVRIYNRVLSLAEIQLLYNAGR